MKKRMSILLIMMMLLTCLLMGFAEEENTAKTEGPINLEDPSTYLGDWHLITMELDGLAMNAVDLGIKITLTLNEDGSATMIAEIINIPDKVPKIVLLNFWLDFLTDFSFASFAILKSPFISHVLPQPQNVRPVLHNHR